MVNVIVRNEFRKSGPGTGSRAGCHTGQGFVNSQIRGEELIFLHAETPSEPANMFPSELQAPITCATCHDPREATHPEEGRFGLMSKQLRIIGEESDGVAQAPPTILHTLEGRDDCTICRQIGLSGVGEVDGMSLPESHGGRIICQTCHKNRVSRR